MIRTWTPERLDIWRRMTPQQRDYDRLVAHSYPPGDGALETEGARQALFEQEEEAERTGCRCPHRAAVFGVRGRTRR